MNPLEIVEMLGDIEVYPASDAYKFDETPKLIAPKPCDDFVVVKPRNTAEVARVLRVASSNSVSVFVRGGGTGLSGGAIPTSPGIVMSMEKMRSLEIDAENRIAVCEAGVTLAELEKAAEKYGLSFLPHPGAKTATVGGMIATNAGGIRAVKYGTIRNHVLGVEAALPSGEILEFGGKVVKNSTGYSLLHLIIGSEGTLCVVTKAYLKLMPALKEMATLAIPFSRIDDAIEFILSLDVIPLAAEFMEKEAVEIGEKVSGKRWVSDEGEGHVLLILESFDEAERVGEVAMRFNAIDVFVASGREGRDLLEIRSHIYEGLRNEIAEILDICVPPARIPEYLRRSREIAERYDIKVITYGHAGDGNVHQHPLTFPDEKYFRFREELFRVAIELGGVISGEHGIGVVKKEEFAKFYPRHVEIMKGIKKIFDPKGILNPGKMI